MLMLRDAVLDRVLGLLDWDVRGDDRIVGGDLINHAQALTTLLHQSLSNLLLLVGQMLWLLRFVFSYFRRPATPKLTTMVHLRTHMLTKFSIFAILVLPELVAGRLTQTCVGGREVAHILLGLLKFF